MQRDTNCLVPFYNKSKINKKKSQDKDFFEFLWDL